MAKFFLIVDDSATDRMRLQSLLEGAGYRTTLATNGAEALQAVKRNRPDAIFMDVNMPEMDGFAATRSLKAEDGTKAIPVVIVSSKGQKADKAWAQMLGATGHVTKPYSDEEMLQQVRAL